MPQHALISFLALTVNTSLWFAFAARPEGRADLRRALLLFSGVVSLWLASDVALYATESGESRALILRGAVALWLPMGVWFLNFVYAYLKRERDALFMGYLILSILFVTLALPSGLVSAGWESRAWGFTEVRGPLHLTATLLTISGAIAGLTMMGLASRKEKEKKKEMVLLVLGSTLLLVVITLFDIVAPITSMKGIPQVGASLLVIFNFFLFYLAKKERAPQILEAPYRSPLFTESPYGAILVKDKKILQENQAATQLLGDESQRKNLLEAIEKSRDDEYLRHMERELKVRAHPLPEQGAHLYFLLDVTEEMEAKHFLKGSRRTSDLGHEKDVIKAIRSLLEFKEIFETLHSQLAQMEPNHPGMLHPIAQTTRRGLALLEQIMESSEDSPAAGEDLHQLKGEGQSILMIEQEAPVAKAGKRLLEGLGYQAVVVRSPEQAFLAMDATSFSAVLLDRELEALHWETLTEALREKDAELPVVLLTLDETIILDPRARTMGVRALLKKPVSMRNLASTLRKILVPEAK